MINYQHPKTVIFFSNPFGYGPTGTLIPIAKKFNDSLKNVQLIFASSGLCNEILNQHQLDKFNFYEINQRSIEEITLFLQRFTYHPLIISCLNRFAIQAAYNIDTSSALIDPLGWFWRQNRPAEYSLAKYYFYNGLNKVKYPGKNHFDIPPITDDFKFVKKVNLNNSIVFHLGGTQNPLVSGIPEKYLDLLIRLINDTHFNPEQEIIIAGGKASTDYINRFITKKITCGSFPFDEFILKIKQCHKIYTPAGMGVTFISIHLKKDLNIFLPHNLSQWALSKTAIVKASAHNIFSWEDYFPFDWKLSQMTEKESIAITSKLSSQVLQDSSLYNKLQKKFSNSISTPNNVINSVPAFRNKGQNFVLRKLITEWHLT
ncbi:MAG: hypothetical protein WC596_03915 [Candidatus Shapirobacteria bacterium]